MANKTRPNKVIFRLSDEELEEFKKRVAASSKNQQEFCRSAVIEGEVRNTDGLLAIIPELKKQGNNLNQIAKALNERKYVDYGDLGNTMREVQEAWKQIRKYLEVKSNE